MRAAELLTAAIFVPILAALAIVLAPRRWLSIAATESGPDNDGGGDDPGDSGVLLVAEGPAVAVSAPAPPARWARVSEQQLQAAATAVSAIPLVLLAVTWLRFEATGGFELVEAARWIPTLDVAYRVGVDGLSLPLAAMTALVFVVAIAYPVDLRGRPVPYFALMLFLEGVSLGLFLALDLFLFFVFWDLSLVGMYFLIGAWGHGDAQRSALKFFLYTLAGSLALLLAILGLYLASDPRTFDMAELIRQKPLGADGLYATLVFLGFFVGFAVKTPLVPFHTWLPPAHVDAPAPASAILAGVLLKMGTYGFVRILMAMMPDTFARFAVPLGVLAVVSIIYGALVALAQSNLKRLIAYTSVNHMGYVILGLAGFVAEFQVFAGTLAIYPVLAGVGLLGIIITAALFLRMLQRLFLGPLPQRWRRFPDLGRAEVMTLGTMIFFVVLVGVYPLWLLDVIDSFAGPFVGRP
ncbi:MAG TPA: NADH-quinone oxidoreductase subunit M [Dehalococcoidia bacterium]